MFKNMAKKRLILLLVSLSLILVAGVGVTLALIIDQSGDVENVFEPSRVSCEVIETFDNEVKSDVKIKNTGDTDAYIRAAVVINWKTADGKQVWAQVPVEGVDYYIDWAFDDATNPTAWEEGGDGYYYFKNVVPPTDGSDLTETLITKAEQLKPGPVGTDDSQYYLSIEIVASAIQSEPSNVVVDMWGVNPEELTN